MRILKELPELLAAGVISEQTADDIRNYYQQKGDKSVSRLFIVFGILGALLVGLGVILIIAHNWDELSQSMKTVLAFVPLIIGQCACAYVLLQKGNNIAWREGAAIFLFFAIGACISLISQIYHISGSMSDFILSWMLLGLPLVYVMNSSITSSLYIIGITYYGWTIGYAWGKHTNTFYYWPLILTILPYYYFLIKKKPKSNFTSLHHWLIPLSLVITLGTLSDKTEELMWIAYMSLLGLLYLIGNSNYLQKLPPKSNGYLTIGSIGTVICLMILSFKGNWEHIREPLLGFHIVCFTPEFFSATLLTVLASALLFYHIKTNPLENIKPLSVVFILFITVFMIGHYTTLPMVLINVMVFVIGVLNIREGAKADHLGLLNYGLIIITVLIICRFFDTDISFVVRGILFVLVGAGFFAANYWMLNKRKTHEA